MLPVQRFVYKAGIFKNTLRKFSDAGKLAAVAVNDKTGIATVTMQRPPVNGLNLELLTDLKTAFQDLEKNKARGMILTSSSNTVFSGGLDIMEMYKPNLDRCRAFWSTLQDVWLALYSTKYPTVACINGHSPAGGCLLSLSCEYRVMVNNYTIGLNETQLGIVAPGWFIASMLNTVSKRTAELALTEGKLFTTEEALKVGLVDEVAADKEEALAKSEKFFKRFARVHPVARSLTKLAMRKTEIEHLMKHREEDIQTFLKFIGDPKVQESLGMYIQSLKKK